MSKPFMIDWEGYIQGYAPGMLSKDMMESIVKQTLDVTDNKTMN